MRSHETMPALSMINGEPCLRGTRLTLTQLVDTLTRTRSAESILAQYPEVDPDQLRAAAEFAARYLVAANSPDGRDESA